MLVSIVADETVTKRDFAKVAPFLISCVDDFAESSKRAGPWWTVCGAGIAQAGVLMFRQILTKIICRERIMSGCREAA